MNSWHGNGERKRIWSDLVCDLMSHERTCPEVLPEVLLYPVQPWPSDAAKLRSLLLRYQSWRLGFLQEPWQRQSRCNLLDPPQLLVKWHVSNHPIIWICKPGNWNVFWWDGINVEPLVPTPAHENWFHKTFKIQELFFFSGPESEIYVNCFTHLSRVKNGRTQAFVCLDISMDTRQSYGLFKPRISNLSLQHREFRQDKLHNWQPWVEALRFYTQHM